MYIHIYIYIYAHLGSEELGEDAAGGPDVDGARVVLAAHHTGHVLCVHMYMYICIYIYIYL